MKQNQTHSHFSKRSSIKEDNPNDCNYRITKRLLEKYKTSQGIIVLDYGIEGEAKGKQRRYL